MDKTHRMFNVHQQTQDSPIQPLTDWTECIICQKATTEALRCPAESKRGTQGAGYKNLADLLQGFHVAGMLPKSLDLSRLDDGGGIEATLNEHKAKWHESCRLLYNRTQLQRVEKRKLPPSEDDDSISCSSSKFTRRSMECASTSIETCYFCGKTAQEESLRKASTFDVDTNVRQCAIKLQDERLLAKLSAGDLIAQDAQYHVQCLVSLYNRARESKASDVTDPVCVNEGIAFAELVSYIEDSQKDSLVAPVFKLADLVNLYATRLKQLGTDVVGRVHSTKLKDRILGYFQEMEAHKKGRDMILIFNKDVGAALKKACDHDADNDAVHLARAANIVRRDMFKHRNQFDGSFQANCQETSVPASLLALVSMVVNGPNIEAQSNATTPQSVFTISQLLMHNSFKRHRTQQSTNIIRHSQERETPLPIYIGVMIHTKTRKRELVDTLYELGISISYDRCMSISTELGNKICSYYQNQNAVCPPELKVGIFTTAAVDNIDHNPSSISAHDAFHGTALSLFQHPDKHNTGVRQVIAAQRDVPNKGKIACLPESYTSIPPTMQVRQDAPIPIIQKGPSKVTCQIISQAVQEEYR